MGNATKIRGIAGVLALAFAVSSQPSRLAAGGSVEPVEASGFADFNDKDQSISRNAAVADALKNAVEEVAGLFSSAPAAET